VQIGTPALVNDIIEIVAFTSFVASDGLAAANNLSDLQNASTARTNLGVTLPNLGVTSTAAELNNLAAVPRGSIIYGNSSAATARLSKGATGTVLTAGADDISWVEASGGGEQTFTATGAITAGQPVGINSNGTISTATALKSGVAAPTLSNALAFQDTSYDTGQDKFLMMGQRNGSAECVVGNISGTTFSFGSAAVFNSANDPTAYPARTTFDAASGKHLLIYSQNSDQRVRARVATVSGTSVSFGTDVVTENGTGGDKYISASNAGDNKVIMIARHESGSAGNYYLWARVFTISGTSVSFGSLVDVSGAAMNSGEQYYGLCYDSNADKVVVFYVLNGNTTLYAKVGTVSGSSVSFGSAVDTGYDCQTSDIRPVFDPSTNKVVLAFSDSGNSNLTKAIVGTVSGTSISFAANPTEFGSNFGNPKAVYNLTNSTIVLSYNFNLEVVKVVGTAVFRDRVFETSTVGSFPYIVYDDNNQSVVATDAQGECISVKTISPKFAGFAKESISNGATGKVTVTGGINTSQSGLISGFDYGLPSDSATLVSGSNNKVGVALSATSILVTEGSI
jgi:hypothetical protein